jgi:hypothetical protein
MNPLIGYYLTYGVASMEFFTNLLRKLRRPKTRTYRYEPRLSEMNRLKEEMNKKPKPTHFEGDMLNGWEHDGNPEPTAWSRGYMTKRTPPDDVQ